MINRLLPAACLLLFAATVLPPTVSLAQAPDRGDRKKPAAAARPAAAGEQESAAIRATAKAFTEAFNRGDAKALAALWTEEGEYVDELGQRFVGRPAIEAEYAQLFVAQPKAQMTVLIDAVRLAGDRTAIEDGRTIVEVPEGGVGHGKYTAVHVKVDGKWLLAQVRDLPLETSSPADHVRDLDWLVGSWSAERNGAKVEVTCRWVAEKQFLQRNYAIKRGDKQLTSGLQIIGWNPQSGGIQSWSFSSDGGHAIGQWTPRPDGWTIHSAGTLPDGTPTEAVNLLTRLDDNSVAWKSVERAAAGTPLADADEIVLKRSDAKR